MTNSSNLQYFTTELLAWYDREKRDLPWRRDNHPYRVWVSEIMLQQTRVDTVIPYFERFMARFPTLHVLADAPEEDVLKAWEGLGYYSRARHLHAAAREVCELYGGTVPEEPDLVRRLPGVGPYTAGAILSIAFNRPEPAVDGNVMRVMSRYFLLEDDVAKPATRAKMEGLVRRLIPKGRPGDFNQAIMDLGATVCTPKNPGCLTCPVMAHCAGRLAGRERDLPVKTKARKPRPEYRAVALIEGTGSRKGKVLIRRRPDQGLLAGMWELPHVLLEGKRFAGAEAALSEGLDGLAVPGGQVVPYEPFTDITHVFTHIRWEMRVFLARLGRRPGADVDLAHNPGQKEGRAFGLGIEPGFEPGLSPGLSPGLESGDGSSQDRVQKPGSVEEDDTVTEYRWIGPEDRDAYTFPNVFNRILDAYWRRTDRLADPGNGQGLNHGNERN